MLSAEARALVQACGDARAAEHLLVVAEAMRHVLRLRVDERPVIGNREALLDYLAASIAFGRVEQLRVLFLDARHHLIADEMTASGCVTAAPFYPREIIKRALDVGASMLILAHNHPSGDPTPSQADKDITRTLARAAKPLGLQVHDHLIVTRSGWHSLRDEGVI